MQEWTLLPLLRVSNSAKQQTVRPHAGSKTEVFILVCSPVLVFPPAASLIIRGCDNHRATEEETQRQGRYYYYFFLSIVFFLCIITGHVPLPARAKVLRSLYATGERHFWHVLPFALYSCSFIPEAPCVSAAV